MPDAVEAVVRMKLPRFMVAVFGLPSAIASGMLAIAAIAPDDFRSLDHVRLLAISLGIVMPIVGINSQLTAWYLLIVSAYPTMREAAQRDAARAGGSPAEPFPQLEWMQEQAVWFSLLAAIVFSIPVIYLPIVVDVLHPLSVRAAVGWGVGAEVVVLAGLLLAIAHANDKAKAKATAAPAAPANPPPNPG